MYWTCAYCFAWRVSTWLGNSSMTSGYNFPRVPSTGNHTRRHVHGAFPWLERPLCCKNVVFPLVGRLLLCGRINLLSSHERLFAWSFDHVQTRWRRANPRGVGRLQDIVMFKDQVFWASAAKPASLRSALDDLALQHRESGAFQRHQLQTGWSPRARLPDAHESQRSRLIQTLGS